MRGAAKIRKGPCDDSTPAGTVPIKPSAVRFGDHVRFRQSKSWLWVTQVGYAHGGPFQGPSYDGEPPLVWFMTRSGQRPAPRPVSEVVRAVRTPWPGPVMP